MIKELKLSSDYFGSLLLLGVIDTYSGWLQYNNDLYRDPGDLCTGESWDDDDDRCDYPYTDFLVNVNYQLKVWFEGFVFDRYFRPLGFKSLKFEKLGSPKYYNYQGDWVEFSLEYDTDFFGDDFSDFAIKKINEVLGDPEMKINFEKLLSEFSSYDGFSSLTPNSLNELKCAFSKGYDEYRSTNAFLAAWLFDEIQRGNIDTIEEDDFLDVVECL